ncbi:hypothetical protein [Chachezhania antarctica]|uniref:hypothetical protein n=1 Tax=Chachezhania antarctica TaxID=2340860 RepID=UPI000EB0BB47|nr:hypothetical protein [Chachezhania antarctica]|tara:strand:+ start:406 stop:813 length:408 start_codon:yes stop_codon:yes gene_type:complete
MNELALAAIYCVLMLGGETEQRHTYSVADETRHIVIDCETPTQVVEVGWDNRGALDSIQQALFAAELSGKAPAILLIDTDGRIGPYETRIRTVAKRTGVEFKTIEMDRLIRWQMTSWLRERRLSGPGSENTEPGF